MTKKKESLSSTQRLSLESTKRNWLLLCQQYAAMGQLLALMGKALSHPLFNKSMCPEVFNRILDQYQEIGEQMKVTGTDLDSIGGEPVHNDLSLPKPKIAQRPTVTKEKVDKPSEADTRPHSKPKVKNTDD